MGNNITKLRLPTYFQLILVGERILTAVSILSQQVAEVYRQTELQNFNLQLLSLGRDDVGILLNTALPQNLGIFPNSN